ncbi:hypothetical protein BJX96DRAFT_180163 [Aspergillus floccosus]
MSKGDWKQRDVSKLSDSLQSFHLGSNEKSQRYPSKDASRSTTYPPVTPVSQHRKQRVEGYLPNHFGQFPPDPMTSSMYLHPKPGYDETRDAWFPSDSPMGRQYKEYKAVADKSSEYGQRYNKRREEAKKHGARNTTAREFRQLERLADKAAHYMEQNAELRTKFNNDHIGRRNKRSYLDHKQEAEQQLAASDNYKVKAEKHSDRRFN